MGKYVVALDTDRIKQYVFATDKVKEIRGASKVFDRLNRIKMEKIVKTIRSRSRKNLCKRWFLEYLLPTQNETRKNLLKKVEREYHEQTITGSIAGVAEALPDGWTMESNVNEQIQRLSYKLRLAKGKILIRKHISHILY